MNFFKQLRKEANLKQVDISEKLGLTSSQFVSNWERGKSLPPFYLIKSLSKIYKCEQAVLKDYMITEKLAMYRKKLEQDFK
jgi:transcriptional regulator with XRE-family HTH domain